MDEWKPFDEAYYSPLRELRLEKEWTQSDLAEKIGVKQPDISMMERGLQPINKARAEKLAELFGVKAEVFLETTNG